MSNKAILTAAIISVFFTACNDLGNNYNNETVSVKHFPRPGTVVAQAEMPITEDKLNHFTFSVKVIADSNVSAGVYDVDADFGPNFAAGQLTMPKGGEDLIPIIRKGTAPYTFIIGFKVKNDTTFYEYYEVSSDHKTTKMKYTKAYTF